MNKRKSPLHVRDLHPIVREAAEGVLPDWAVAGKHRRAHIKRVADLMDAWSRELGLQKVDRMRWRAAATLHDALRDAPGKRLRPLVPPRYRPLPDRVLHGPAAAKQLKAAGVLDRELLRAVRFHTLGHPKLGALGRSLCVADFVEPQRLRMRSWRDDLKDRMPDDVDAVVTEIFRSRIRLVVKRGEALTPWTVEFWNILATEDRE